MDLGRKVESVEGLIGIANLIDVAKSPHIVQLVLTEVRCHSPYSSIGVM